MKIFLKFFEGAPLWMTVLVVLIGSALGALSAVYILTL